MAKVYCGLPCKSEKTEHKFLEENGDYNERYLIKCEDCGFERELHRKEWLFAEAFGDERKSQKAYLTKWPHMNWSMGEMVKSKDHMKEIAKKKGYTPVE